MRCPSLVLGWLAVLAGPPVLAQSPVISEIMADNGSTLADEDGEFSDWVEIYNPGPDINLLGWGLTDSQGTPFKWTFPSVTLSSGGFLLVFASDKNRVNPAANLHTNFRLSSGGEYLALVSPGGARTSEFNPFPALGVDESHGVVSQSGVLFARNAAARYRVPSVANAADDWTATNHVDTAWAENTAGFGFPRAGNGFNLRMVKLNVSPNNVGEAITYLQDPARHTFTATATRPVVNCLSTAGGGRYASDQPFPGLSIGVDDQNFVMEAIGAVVIPSAGAWTFGVNSDDGFRLTLRRGSTSFTTEFAGVRAPADTLGVFNLPAAGVWDIELIFFEKGGGAACEMFAAPGSHATWNATDFDLVGDTANGGLNTSGLNVDFGTDVESAMKGVNPSLWMRAGFSLPSLPAFDRLVLRVQYEDGFAAHLNGVSLGSRNAPVPALWNSAAVADRALPLAAGWLELDVTSAAAALRTGQNVLAVQGLNDAAGDGHFLVQPELRTVTETGVFRRFAQASPGGHNFADYLGALDEVVFSVPRCVTNTAFVLSLAHPDPAAEIFVGISTNGTMPEVASMQPYAGPLAVSRTSVVRAFARLAGFRDSRVDTHTYVFPADVVLQQPLGQAPSAGWPTNAVNGQVVNYGMDPDIVNHAIWGPLVRPALESIASVSIVTDLPSLFHPSTGIWVNATFDGPSWERACSMEIIPPPGQPSSQGLQIDAGLRIRGGASRSDANPKHGFRLFFSDRYEGPLEFPLFGTEGVDRFEKLDLRTAQNYGWQWDSSSEHNTFLRELWARDTQRDMGWPYTRSRFYHLYLNGVYWGLFLSQERSEAAFAESYLGGLESDYDVIKVAPDDGYIVYATDGTTNGWDQVYRRSVVTGLAANADYFALDGRNPDGTVNPALRRWVDVDNLTDFMSLIYWDTDRDCPISNFLSNTSPNNFYALFNRNDPARGFQFLSHDGEHTMFNPTDNRLGPWPAGSVFNKFNPQYLCQQLLTNAEYRVRFADAVQRHCFNGGVLTPAASISRLNARKAEIESAIVAESARWGDATAARATNPFTRTDWQNAVNGVVAYMNNRTSQHITQLRAKGWFPAINAPACTPYGGVVAQGAAVVLSAGAGVIYYTTDGTDPRLVGGGVSPSAQVYTPGVTSLTISASGRIRARALQGAEWSAMITPWFAVGNAAASIRVTEMMFHPPEPPAGSPHIGEDFEYIELRNTGAAPVDLAGLTFTNGVEVTLPATLLPAGAYALIVRNPAAFATRYDTNGLRIVASYAGSLNNAGEAVEVRDSLGAVIQSFAYADWYPETDGAGASLVINEENGSLANWSLASGWHPSARALGSPGRAEPSLPAGALVVNEVLAHTDADTDWVEIHNAGALPVDISGWLLSDDPARLAKFVIPAGTVVPPAGYVRFTADTQFNNPAHPGTLVPFGLSELGEEVLLSSAVSGQPGTELFRQSFDASEREVTSGRWRRSDGEVDFTPMSAATPLASNAYPRVGPVVISELMYDNAPGGDEFIELRNVTASPVALYDPENPAHAWALSGAIDFPLPTGITLAAHTHLLVVPIVPSLFRAKYGVPADVLIVGPYAGALSNAGEDLRLTKPGDPEPGGFVPHYLVDRVDFLPGPPWPAGAAGAGHSLQRAGDGLYGNDPASWMASLVEDGSPGEAFVLAARRWLMANGIAEPFAVNETLDPDGDGVPTWQEYHMGTDPNLDGSVLRLSVAETSPAWRISWHGISNRTYRLSMTTNLVLGAWMPVPAQGPLSGADAPIEVEVPALEPRVYFRVDVSPQP